jgi:GT2 family glycosyltransferase
VPQIGIIQRMQSLSIIITNFNTRDLLEKCLFNLQNIYPILEIIVVDNGFDGSSAMVEERFPQVRLITTGNKGLANAYNLGLEKATSNYILFLGTDAFPTKQVIGEMMIYMEQNPEVGIATSKLVLRDGTVDMDAHRGFPTPWAALTHFSRLNRIFPKSKLFNRYFLGGSDMSTPHEIDLCIAHFMFVRKSVFEKIGELDESFFLYGEDVDFCYRTKEAGFKIMYLPQFEVLHYKGASVGIRKQSEDVSSASKETKKRMRTETTRSMKLFYEKHYKNKYPFWLTSLVFFAIDLLGKIRDKGFLLG